MPFLSTLQQFMRRILRRGPAEPQDPYARVRVPVRCGPPGRAAAVALEEPRKPHRTNLFGRWNSKPDC